MEVSEYKRLPRRNELDLKVDMLNAAQRPIPKTALMYRCNLNSKSLNTLLKELLDLGLLESIMTKNDRRCREVFGITEYGKRLLSRFSYRRDLISGDRYV
jgi:predicted transcriptional regulator